MHIQLFLETIWLTAITWLYCSKLFAFFTSTFRTRLTNAQLSASKTDTHNWMNRPRWMALTRWFYLRRLHPQDSKQHSWWYIHIPASGISTRYFCLAHQSVIVIFVVLLGFTLAELVKMDFVPSSGLRLRLHGQIGRRVPQRPLKFALSQL